MKKIRMKILIAVIAGMLFLTIILLATSFCRPGNVPSSKIVKAKENLDTREVESEDYFFKCLESQ